MSSHRVAVVQVAQPPVWPENYEGGHRGGAAPGLFDWTEITARGTMSEHEERPGPACCDAYPSLRREMGGRSMRLQPFLEVRL